ncbi:hypothetical protein [Nocardioides sp. LML1-1-1.1]|uniref:AbiTii domain-containing protein n=1 Tax=Nocardioides sp. LML1-1-1.1 TaxID=3135248 RepID=UPI00342D06AE
MDEDLDLLGAVEADIVADAPIAPTLRRVILLGGRAGSSPLRDWAARELNGYDDLADLPRYRRIPSAICVDATVGNTWRKGYVISPNVLPEYAREVFEGGPTFFQGIGTIEAMAREARQAGGSTRITHRYSMDLCRELDKGSPFQETTALYWQVTASNLEGIVERVKTVLAELTGAMRSGTPVGAPLPDSAVVSEAVRAILGTAGRSSRT